MIRVRRNKQSSGNKFEMHIPFRKLGVLHILRRTVGGGGYFHYTMFYDECFVE